MFDRLAPVLRGPLVPVGQRLKTLHRAPMTRLGAESDALAVETVRRMVHLRLLPTVDNPVEAALYTLFGVWLCAWTSIEPSRFGPAAAAWCRAIRADEVREQLGNVATIARG